MERILARRIPPQVRTRSGRVHYRLSCKVKTSRESQSIGQYHQASQSPSERIRMVSHFVMCARYARNEAYRLTGRVFAACAIGGEDPAQIGISQAGRIYRLLELLPVPASVATSRSENHGAKLSPRQVNRLADTCRRIEARCQKLDADKLENHKFYHLCRIQLQKLRQENQVTRQRKRKPVEKSGPFRQIPQRSMVEWVSLPLGLRAELASLKGVERKPVSEAYRLQIAALALVEYDRVQGVAQRKRAAGKDDAKYLADATWPIIVRRARSAYRSEATGRMGNDTHKADGIKIEFMPEEELASIHARRVLASVASEPKKADDRLHILRQYVDSKVIELVSRGLSFREVSKLTGIPKTSILRQISEARKAFADVPARTLEVVAD